MEGRMQRLRPVLVAAAMCMLAMQGHAAPSGIVGTESAKFKLGERYFTPVGANMYWLQKYFTFGEGAKRTARNALDEAVDKLSANVIRIWAFGEGYDMNEHPMQKSPEDYNEYALQALDEAIYEMSLRNVRAVLTLGNHWNAYGGAPKYVQWANSRGEGLSEDKEFYDNALCKYWYKQYISKIMDRYNGWTGYMYRDDPAIFSYELINEARYPGDEGGTRLNAWYKEMAAHAKEHDWKHLLTTGSEGFFGKSSYSLLDKIDLSWSAWTGADQVENHKPWQIDYLSNHLWVDSWLSSSTCDAWCKVNFMRNWLDAQHEAAKYWNGKPVLLAEYNKFNVEGQEKWWYFKELLKKQEANKWQGADGGDLVWYWGTWEYQKNDKFAVYPFDNAITGYIRRHKWYMN